jgi:hypothetical protein
MVEGFYKLPRILKDMLGNLLEEVNYDQRFKSLRIVGFIHSGLSSVMIQMDRPILYISRVSRSKQIDTCNSVVRFSTTVLPAIVSAWVYREIVNEVISVISNSENDTDDSDASWLDNCLTRSTLPPMPVTSTSTKGHDKVKEFSKK